MTTLSCGYTHRSASLRKSMKTVVGAGIRLSENMIWVSKGLSDITFCHMFLYSPQTVDDTASTLQGVVNLFPPIVLV